MHLRLLAVALTMSLGGTAAAQGQTVEKARCTFQTLPAAERDRYESRYKRRVRIDGQAYADNWLQEQACPTPAQEAAKKKRLTEKRGLTDKQGRPCKNIRMVNRATPGFGGAGMSMSLVPKCAD